MHVHKLLPQDIVMIHDEDLGFIAEISAEEFLNGSSSNEIKLGETIKTDHGEKRIVEMEVKFPNPGEIITRYKIVLGIYPKPKK